MRRTSLVVVATLVAGLGAWSSTSAAVDYVKVCDQYGRDFYYSPGTDVCVNAVTGETRQATENGLVISETDLSETAKDAKEGVALSLALPNAVVDEGKSFGAAVNLGTFEGEMALGLSGAFKPADGITVNGAVGVGLQRGTSGGRVGVNLSW